MALFRIKLDHDGVYWGAEPADAIDMTNTTDVYLDHCPDNAPGRYRWDAKAGALIALPPSQIKTSPEAPSLDQAFHHLVESLKEAGHALPASVHAWCDEFKKTIDGVKD